MTTTEPCRTCGSTDVTVTQVAQPARGGDSQTYYEDARRCLAIDCPTNTGTARSGDAV